MFRMETLMSDSALQQLSQQTDRAVLAAFVVEISSVPSTLLTYNPSRGTVYGSGEAQESKWCLRYLVGRKRAEPCKPLFGELGILTLVGLVGYESCMYGKLNVADFLKNRDIMPVARHSTSEFKRPV
ncbi:hypothetical protein J6590_086608 [Homalodisca vitripennis]|nr:hypothetical protein J6590_086608 [Homalodisca vitripennis]